MNIKNTKYKYTSLWVICILSIFAIFNFSCERQPPDDSGFDCENCYQDKPEIGSLLVNVTINEENQFVPITIYIGNIEDNNIEHIDTTWVVDYWVDVPVDKYYSVTAKYKSGDNTIIVVDGDNFKLKKNTRDCDEDCWYYKGGLYDIRLLNK